MEREEVERVRRELDEILERVQPELAASEGRNVEERNKPMDHQAEGQEETTSRCLRKNRPVRRGERHPAHLEKNEETQEKEKAVRRRPPRRKPGETVQEKTDRPTQPDQSQRPQGRIEDIPALAAALEPASEPEPKPVSLEPASESEPKPVSAPPAKGRRAKVRRGPAVKKAVLHPGVLTDLERPAKKKKKNQELKVLIPDLKILKPSDGLIAAFFVPVVVMIIIFAQRGIFPFGEESFLRTDMYHQYAPFFSEFQYKLTHGGSLLYSWDIGMGVNFSALYAYYLASPVNWLLIFCPKAHIIEFMTLWIVIKIGLSGLSFAWYLQRHCKVRDFCTGLFGIFYALSGYMAAYSWNIMWLDCIALFPLVLLGLERLVKEKKPLMYCITLGLCILSNYYISIMICIFMVIYFGALLVLNPPRRVAELFGTGVRFGLCSLAAGGLAAVVLLPEICVLSTTASGDVNFPQTFSSYFSIFDMIARHIPNVETEIGLDHWPNLYCGVAVLMFLPMYLSCRQIPFREKAVYTTLLVMFYASFSINVLNFIWHGFHYPNSLPCRQSFIYIAMVLLMSYRACMNLNRIPWRSVAKCFGVSAAFVILAEKLVDNTEQFHFIVFYVALLYLALYAGLIYLYQHRKRAADFVLLGALALTTVEAAVNTGVTSVPTTSRTAYTRDNQDVAALVEEIPAETFYRVEKVNRKTKNDGAWMNFPSVSLFSSTANASLSEFFRMLGCESSTNAYSITGSTPLVDSLFSVKYGLYDQELEPDEYRTLIDHVGETWLYENIYTLPVAFMLPEDVETNWILNSGNPAWVQNDLSKILNVSPVLSQVELIQSGTGYTFTPEVTGEYYAYVTNNVQTVRVTTDTWTETFENLDRRYLIELGTCAAGEQLTLESADEGSTALQIEVYRFNPQGLEEIYNVLNASPMTVTRWTDVNLEGTIQAAQAGVMYTSIPYDPGWTVLVDGIQTEPRKLFDTFLAIDLSQGSHTIQMSYQPQGLKTGAAITGVSVVLVAAAAAVYRMKDQKKKEKGEE